MNLPLVLSPIQVLLFRMVRVTVLGVRLSVGPSVRPLIAAADNDVDDAHEDLFDWEEKERERGGKTRRKKEICWMDGFREENVCERGGLSLH